MGNLSDIYNKIGQTKPDNTKKGLSEIVIRSKPIETEDNHLQREVDLKREAHLQREVDLKGEAHLQREVDLKREAHLQREVDLKNKAIKKERKIIYSITRERMTLNCERLVAIIKTVIKESGRSEVTISRATFEDNRVNRAKISSAREEARDRGLIDFELRINEKDNRSDVWYWLK